MRDLKTNDVFAMSRIIKKMKLKDEIKVPEVEGKTQEQVGAEFGLTLAYLVAENIGAAQKEVNEFMGSLVGRTGEEFGELPITETLKYFEEFRKIPGIANFFKQAGRLTNKMS